MYVCDVMLLPYMARRCVVLGPRCVTTRAWVCIRRSDLYRIKTRLTSQIRNDSELCCSTMLVDQWIRFSTRYHTLQQEKVTTRLTKPYKNWQITSPQSKIASMFSVRRTRKAVKVFQHFTQVNLVMLTVKSRPKLSKAVVHTSCIQKPSKIHRRQLLDASKAIGSQKHRPLT